MPTSRRSVPTCVVVALVGIAIGLSLFAGGCNKKDSVNGDPGINANAKVVVIPNSGVKPDGTLTDEALQMIQAESAAPNVTVAFYRSPVTDGALVQIAKFPNVKRIEAVGGKITDKGVEKLKSTNSQIEVAR